jgi:hypothetical protein
MRELCKITVKLCNASRFKLVNLYKLLFYYKPNKEL